MSLPRVYAVLDVDLARGAGHDPVSLADAWLEAGVRLFQLRAKRLPSGPLVELASILAERARQAAALFIVNDRADIARLVNATGVHLGQDDLEPADARRVLAPEALIGLSTHTTDQVRAAREWPVSYLAIGPVYATASKDRPDPVVDLAGVRRAVALAGDRPVVAIGGITIERAPAVIAAGAASVAVIADLLVGDPRVRARAWLHAVA